MIPRRLAKAVKEAEMQRNPTFLHKIFYIAFWFWFELKYDLMEWFLLKTAAWRLVHSKKIVITTPHLLDGRPLIIEDIEINDGWGFWLPYGFEIITQTAFDEENKFNTENGFDLSPWQDFRDEGYAMYMIHIDELTPEVIVNMAKKHMNKMVGEVCHSKTFEVRLQVISDAFIQEENERIAEWEAAGKPPYKVVWTEGAKEDVKGILGDEAAEKLWDDKEVDG